MTISKYFWPLLTVGLVLSIVALAMDGGGDSGPLFWLVVLSIGVSCLGLSTLLTTNQTARIIAGSILFGYGVWWIALPWIEADYNFLTGTLLIIGAGILIFSILDRPKAKKDRFNWRVYLVFLVLAAILGVSVFTGCYLVMEHP